MDKIIDFFSKWDKVVHVLVSMTLMLVFTALASLFLNNWIAIGVGSVICLFCGVGKEAYDSKTDRVCSIKDFYADLVGWVIATITLIIFSI